MLLRSLCFSALLSSAICVSAQVPYGVADWPETGFGNHRAVVRVNEQTEAVWAHLDWRRRDMQPEKKDIRVFDATGQRVMNVVRVNITRETGDIVFEPVAGAGEYFIYYLPYNPGVSNFDDPGTYFTPVDTADAGWIARNNLQLEKLQATDGAGFSPAELLRIEARGDFHRMDPMEVIATAQETEQLLARYPDASYILFPEDRLHAIRMFESIPQRWVNGPAEKFTGEAQPNEYYPWQIGVWAARAGIADLEVEFSDLRSVEGKVIPASEISCFNKSGIDWLGKAFSRKFEVGRGAVRALWFGVQIPADAKGTFSGSITIKPQDLPEKTVPVNITVAGEMLVDQGVGDLWRLSRLKWLNSTLGVDNDVIPPYTPLKISGQTVSCLLRDVRFSDTGLPASIKAKGREILAAPMRFIARTRQGEITWSDGQHTAKQDGPGMVRRSTTAQNEGLSLSVTSAMEAEGCISYVCKLKADRRTSLQDFALEIPMRLETADYCMGFGQKGGYRPAELHWKWNIEKADNQLWVGDCDGGVQLYLQPDKDNWDVITLREIGLPKGWSNEGKGGCDLTEDGNRVMIRAYTGARRLAAGEEVMFRFRLLLTPFKPLDTRHWNWRYGDIAADGNILHIHHGEGRNPYINYPFVKVQELTDTVQQARTVLKRTDQGSLTYPAEGNWNPKQGALHVWARLNFDPTIGEPMNSRFNQEFVSFNFPNQDSLGFYWNVDVRGMRTYVRKGAPSFNQYPTMVDANNLPWAKGERHLITLSWGDNLSIYIDGKLKSQGGYTGLALNDLKGATIDLQGEGFIYDAIKITDQPYTEGQEILPEFDAHTLLLDTYAMATEGETKPERGMPGKIKGTIVWADGQQGKELQFSARLRQGEENGVNLYYTVRELSNHVAEMWPLQSLGNEIFSQTQSFVYSVDKTFFGQAGGGYPWLQEHLVAGYVPAWRQPLWGGDHCAAIATQGLSRWHNYYVEGMQWLMQNTGIDGLYLDGIGYDREIMKRIAKVMARTDPDYRINFHSGNNYAFMNWHTSPANSYMEHFPFISNLWFGEMYDYNETPDYWLVEISGIPFGLTSEMLEYSTGGNPYRGMVYGMTGRQHPSAPSMWKFWDAFGIQDAQWIGYWDDKCPVKTDNAGVLATVYRKPGQSLIALGHWPATKERKKATFGTETAKLTSFTVHAADYSADKQTQVKLWGDAEKLHISFECDTNGAALKADATEQDGPVYADDAMELFIQPDLTKLDYFQFVGNSKGVYLDGIKTDNTWDGPWEYNAWVKENTWGGEVSISWHALGIAKPTEGMQIGFNACRDQQTPNLALSCWTPVSGSFHNPEQFGILTWNPQAPATQEAAPDKTSSSVTTHLTIDWKALGINPDKAILSAPAINSFQNAAEFSPDEAIPIENGKGWLLILKEGT